MTDLDKYIEACSNSDIDQVQLYYSKLSDTPNILSIGIQTAIINHKFEVFQYLVSYGDFISNREMEEFVIFAIESEFFGAVEYLVDNYTFSLTFLARRLDDAVECNSESMVLLFIEMGVRFIGDYTLKTKKMILTFCESGSIEVIRTAIEKWRLNYSLYVFEMMNTACEHDQVDMVKYFVEELRIDASLGLIGSVENNSIDLVRYLTENDAVDYTGEAFFLAIKQGYVEMVKYFISKVSFVDVAVNYILMRGKYLAASSRNSTKILELF